MEGTPALRDNPSRQHSHDSRSVRGMRWRRVRRRIPSFAVTLVVVTAVATAVMVAPTVSGSGHQPPVAAGSESAVTPPPAVVQAPPLDRPAPVVPQGAGPACRDCGVVESVVALMPQAQDDAVAYQMRIRMDDGSLRTVEQRGALATGSRVMVARGSVRTVSGRPGPG